MTINETFIIGDPSSGTGLTFTSVDNTVDIVISGDNIDFSVATADTNTFTSEDNTVEITISGSNIDFSVATASTTTITSEDNSLNITFSGNNFDLSVISTDSIISGSTEPITSGGVYDGFINKEDISNKISVISGSSLTEYPNEKAIVDYVAVAVSAVTYLAEYTYSGLMNLVNNNQLVVGRKYILTDYQTKYIINGSDSSTRQQIHAMVGAAGAYTQFTNVPSTIASNGDVITCVFAPTGATIVSGQTFTIIDYFNTSYILLSPTVNNLANIGARFRFEKQRYANISSNITINDINGKPVIKPTGVLNTEVHDSLPYMSMLGSENPTPITEKIVLTAIDVNAFSHNAESLTFIGDTLEYDFNNNIINDDNGNFKANKNGTILKRTNVNTTISTNNDWRVQRYRRYRMDDANWNNYTYRKEFSGLSGTSGTTIYKIGSTNYCTNTNPTISVNHRYVVPEPFITNFYTDFAKTANNVFLSGVTTAPSLLVGERMPISVGHVTEYSVNMSLPLSGFSGTTLAKDFHMIPISSGSPTSDVTYFNVQNISNVVFLTNTQKYGLSGSIYVDSRDGTITNSSFMTGFPLVNHNVIDRLTTIDYVGITNFNKINNCNILGYGLIENKGSLLNSSFGQGEVGVGTNEYFEYYFGDNSWVIDSVFGSIRIDTFFYNGFVSNKSIVLNNGGSNNKFNGNMYLTLYKNANSIFGSEMKINTYVNQIPSKGYYGHIYDFNIQLADKIVDNFTVEHNLIYKNITGTTINVVNVTTPL